MSEQSVLMISTKYQRQPLQLVDDRGTSRDGYVCELRGEQRSRYQDGMLKRSKTTGSGAVTASSVDGIERDLLVMCLYYKDEQRGAKEGAHVGHRLATVEEINDLPSQASQALFDVAQKLSKIGKYSKGVDTTALTEAAEAYDEDPCEENLNALGKAAREYAQGED